MNSVIHISSAGTYVVDPNGGILKRIIVNTSASGIITVYDNTAASGVVIAVLKSAVLEGSFEYDIPYVNGLTIVTVAASDITVVFT